jgi:hypothetical protein
MKNWVDLTRQPKRLLRPDYDILHWAIEGGGKPLSYALEVKHQGTKLLTCHFDLPLQWPLNSLMSIKERYTKSELVQCHESSFHSTSRTRTTQTTRSLIRSTIWSIEPGYCFRIPWPSGSRSPLYVHILHLLCINLVCCRWTLYLNLQPLGTWVYKLYLIPCILHCSSLNSRLIHLGTLRASVAFISSEPRICSVLTKE